MIFDTIADLKWQGRPVVQGEVLVRDLPDALPTFKRLPFAFGQHRHEYLEMIARNPFQLDERTIPIATVSKKYALVQHVDLARQIKDALEDDSNSFQFDYIANVYLSEYGERFSASICFDDSLLDPGDGFPLIIRLYIVNSVDGSCPIEISLRWLRQVCTNGMTVLHKQDKLEQIHHLDRINPVAIRDFIATRVPKAIAAEKETFGRWLDLKIVDKAFKVWIQKDVRDAWGLHAAARLYHICERGYDGRVGREKPGVRTSPLNLFVSSDQEVPGAAAPVKNVYHVYQALVWLCEHRNTLEDRELRGQQALLLIKKLRKRLGF